MAMGFEPGDRVEVFLEEGAGFARRRARSEGRLGHGPWARAVGRELEFFPLSQPFFWLGGTKIDYRKKLVPTYSDLSTGGPS